jgi:hypothetical protein
MDGWMTISLYDIDERFRHANQPGTTSIYVSTHTPKEPEPLLVCMYGKFEAYCKTRLMQIKWPQSGVQFLTETRNQRERYLLTGCIYIYFS